MNLAVLPRLFLFLVMVGWGGALASAQSDDAIKARMAQRLPVIDALKDRGAVGENNHGLLEIRGQVAGPEETAVADENSDRRTVYVALARQTGSTPEAVGRQRAQQIAMRSKRGVWIQDAGGEWRQKG
jgi:uncharacterized protein